MPNSAKLDDLELVLLKHEDDEPSNPLEDLRTILSAWTSDRRSIVEHKVPGKEASVLQDLGRHSLSFGFVGEFVGTEAKTTAEALWQKFSKGKVVPFSSDIVALTEVSKVLIERLDFEELAGDLARFRYHLLLREYKDPEEEQEASPSQEDEAQDATDDATDDASGSVNYVTGKVLDEDKSPVKGAKVVINGDPGEFHAETDENGVFRKDDLKPGTYDVSIDAPGYEDQKQTVEIKSGDGNGKSEASEGGGEGDEDEAAETSQGAGGGGEGVAAGESEESE
jgi:carboxypeptidase family protein/DNA circularisation protein